MDNSLKLSLGQKLQQKLSPLQIRYGRVLEMNAPEIEEEVRQELDDNPALAVADAQQDDFSDETFSESAEQLQMADYRDEDDIPSYRLEARNHSVNDVYREPVAVAGGNTLMEHLSSQLAEMGLGVTDLRVADYIIGNIDDNGYLTRTLPAIIDDLAINQGLDVADEDVRRIYNTVRSLDPAGVGAIDLRDCLLLQLKRRRATPDVKVAREIVSDYFDLFSLKHYDRLRSSLGVTRQQLQEAVDVIRTLDPKPGSVYADAAVDDRVRHIIPDFSVEVDGGSITLTLLNNIPELCIEETFAAVGDDRAVSQREREAAAFVRRKRDEASDFIAMLKLRQSTLYSVMSAIVKIQRDFFLTDDETKLRPMRLRDIGAVTGLDLSVISRAAAGKYVTTPGGVYPLKFFFNDSAGSDDEDASVRKIIAEIKDIVDNEDHARPLSDDAITAELRGRGYDIARRTVAKYRERLGYPVARLRKEV